MKRAPNLAAVLEEMIEREPLGNETRAHQVLEGSLAHPVCVVATVFL